MEKEILDMAKQTFHYRKEYQEKIKRKMDKLEALKMNPIVQEYVRLASSFSEQELSFFKTSEDELLESVIEAAKCALQDTNEIYFFCGHFLGTQARSKKYYFSSVATQEQEEIGQYINIENNKTYDIPKEQCQDFEQGKIIIPAVESSFPALTYEFRHLQKSFFETAIRESEEAAIQKVKQYPSWTSTH